MRIHLKSVVIFAAMVLTAWSAKASDAMQRIKETGILRVGIANEAPYSYVKPNGELTGVDYEVASAVSKKIGISTIDGVPMKFGSLIPALKARRIDAIAVGLYIRPKRCEQVAFTTPTMAISAGLLVKAGNPKKIHSYQDMIKHGLILGGVVGGAGPKNAKVAGLPEKQISLFPDWQSGKAALKSGRVDAVVMTSVSAAFEIQMGNDPTIGRALPFNAIGPDGKRFTNYTGYAFHPEDKTLFQAFNNELRKFLGNSKHLEILKRYGLGEEDVPKKLSTAQLCAQ